MWTLTGAIIGVILITVIIACIMYYIRCFRSAPPTNEITFGNMLKKTACPRVSIREVYSATNHLNEMNIIGEGTAGKVYKGILTNKQDVAVKHIINDDGNIETFVREVTSLSHVRHPNLVALLGFCNEADECFLVYELCPNGSLSEWLFGKNKVLSWIQRLEIAIDSARGLWFLHAYPGGCIVHRDIKPTNILLGPKFEAKLSDFGLSKVIEAGETYVSSEVRGTFGYVDPEYQSNRHVNSSGDVYSFGMVLLQILSGKKVINLKLKKPMPLSKMAKLLTKNGSITEFADPKLKGEYSEEAFDFTLQLALACTALNQQRPSMELVVIKLEEALLISKERKVYTTETPADKISKDS
ncbi:probable receptor-like protein kinase At5g18500 [Lotus japonicus]|uniref:probable receptor-like protein kinase At5g18500 n=1 Tax=Lotus japonicus TaxID=34305 RepID=UPI002589150B|nr:probable receptor-like protein kinase At5g18500 [Lotus japonicus]